MNQVISIIVPVRTVSEMNVREHWGKRASRAKKQRSAARTLVRVALASHGFPFGKDDELVILLTRSGKRKLDGDNLQSSLKHVRDGIADALQRDDGSESLTWLYEQKSGAYEVLVSIKLDSGKEVK